MSNHAELFNGLLEAGKALEELPQVKAQLDSVKSDLDLTNNLLESVQQDLNSRDAEIARLKADLAAREAELASATFREAEASAKINNLRAILGTGEPVPVVATEPVTAKESPYREVPTINEANADLREVLAAEGGSEPKPVAYQDEVDAGYVTNPEAYEVKPTPAPLSGPDSQATTYGVVDEAGRFVSHDPAPEATPELVRPFLNRPHWQKPGSLTWGEWATKGGLTPTWYDSRYDEFKTA